MPNYRVGPDGPRVLAHARASWPTRESLSTRSAVKYQLVLQFRGDTLADYDQMIAVEDEVTAALGNSAEVDGHDCGSGETNIFILTSNPAVSFARIRHTLHRLGQLDSLIAAYRPLGAVDFTNLWPENRTESFSVR